MDFSMKMWTEEGERVSKSRAAAAGSTRAAPSAARGGGRRGDLTRDGSIDGERYHDTPKAVTSCCAAHG